jgi:hypothetical protein
MEPREEKEGKRVKVEEGPSDKKITIKVKKVLKQNAQGPPLSMCQVAHSSLTN